MNSKKSGLLLINIGSPETPEISAVRRYLREFLADKRVIDLPAPLRYILLYVFILPFRPRRSAQAYQEIWTENGSPLIVHSEELRMKLQSRLGEQCHVVLGMRYGKPSIADALAQLQSCEHITVLPLYPQYSSAATGSAIEKVLRELTPKAIFPTINIIRDFYQHPAFIHAQAACIKPYLANQDHVLFSYHGLPENHLQTIGCKPVCTTTCPLITSSNQACYRAQCQQTTALLANALGLTDVSTSFQSRLGKTPWIKPYTDTMLTELASRGIKRLVITCPSFVTDCLETLEEIGIRAKEQWLKVGGEALTMVPCMNANDLWIDAIVSITGRVTS